jgi:hypothetical protein
MPMATAACPYLCTGHGYCDNVRRECVCASSYNGTGCQIQTVPLQPNVTMTGYVPQGVWVYYFLTSSIIANNSVTVSMTPTTFGGDADLYLQLEEHPTLTTYLARNITQFFRPTAKITTVVLSSSGTVYIGVYGFVATAYTLNVSVMFVLAGWTEILVIVVPVLIVVASTLLAVLVCYRKKTTDELPSQDKSALKVTLLSQ